jgi:site-specific DNA-adenine methylase
VSDYFIKQDQNITSLYIDPSYPRINNRMATTSDNQSTTNAQQEEISSLREHFKDKIRILSSIGQFSYILKIRADPYDVSLTLQLDRKSRMKF